MAVNKYGAVGVHGNSLTASFASAAAAATPTSSKQTDNDLDSDSGNHGRHSGGADCFSHYSLSNLIDVVEHKYNEIMTVIETYDRAESANFRYLQQTFSIRSDDANASALRAIPEHSAAIGSPPVPSPLEYSATGSLVLSARYMAEKRATAALKQVAALYEASDDAAKDYISRNHDEEMKHGFRNYTRGLLIDIQVWKREKTEMEMETHWA
ncbi:MAG: hypothetical protein ASARMPREDX12_002812 [Alectoria sarmentosa]|nr:MAG: hypothetical protein ASARMPREDX12_002812 [Alectoria sarmentosa]